MEILFLILKIIGIILLSAVGFVLLLAALVLLVPVRYDITLKNETKDIKNITVKAQISWFLKLVYFGLDYFSETGFKSEFKLFIFTLFRSDEKVDMDTVDKKKKNKKKKDKDSDEKDDESDTDESEKKKKRRKKKKSGKKKVKKIDKETGEEVSSGEDESDTDDEELEEAGVIEKIRYGYELLKQPEFKVTFQLVMHELWYLIKHYMIRRVKGNVVFSAGSPDLTGQVLGVMAMFLFFYSRYFSIRPDFEEYTFYIMGDVRIHGYVRLVHLVKSIIVVIASKDFRTVVKKVMDWP